jgi:hypothetical protein
MSDRTITQPAVTTWLGRQPVDELLHAHRSRSATRTSRPKYASASCPTVGGTRGGCSRARCHGPSPRSDPARPAQRRGASVRIDLPGLCVAGQLDRARLREGGRDCLHLAVLGPATGCRVEVGDKLQLESGRLDRVAHDAAPDAPELSPDEVALGGRQGPRLGRRGAARSVAGDGQSCVRKIGQPISVSHSPVSAVSVMPRR